MRQDDCFCIIGANNLAPYANEKKKINYIHLDEKKGITTIMYLSDVTETDGPFRYVKGSHDAPCSYILKALHEFMSCDLKINSPEQMKR